jgi:hypothetical protein
VQGVAPHGRDGDGVQAGGHAVLRYSLDDLSRLGDVGFVVHAGWDIGILDGLLDGLPFRAALAYADLHAAAALGRHADRLGDADTVLDG